MGAPDPALIRLIEEDLYNELRWMLVAASEWQADRDADKAWAGRPGHLDVAAMDTRTKKRVRFVPGFFTWLRSGASNPKP